MRNFRLGLLTTLLLVFSISCRAAIPPTPPAIPGYTPTTQSVDAAGNLTLVYAPVLTAPSTLPTVASSQPATRAVVPTAVQSTVALETVGVPAYSVVMLSDGNYALSFQQLGSHVVTISPTGAIVSKSVVTVAAVGPGAVTPGAATQPALIRGTQGAWIYAGAYNAGVAFPTQNNPARKAIEAQQNLTAIRIYGTIPNRAVLGGPGDNQADTLRIIVQARAEGKLLIPDWTPNHPQAYASPFLPSAALIAWETQWLNAAEAATGAKAATLFPLGVEAGSELQFPQFWAGKQAEIPAFVATTAAVLHARGVKVIGPAWNGTGGVSDFAAFQAFYTPILGNVDAIGEHPYSYPGAPGLVSPGQWFVQTSAWANKPIICTEFNAITVNTNDPVGDAAKLKAALADVIANGQGRCLAVLHWPSVVTPSIPGGQNGLVTQSAVVSQPQFNAFLPN